MAILDSILDAVGNTPMVRLNRITGIDCAEILVRQVFEPGR